VQAAVAGTVTAVVATGAVVAARNDAAADAMAAPFEALWDQVSTSAPVVCSRHLMMFTRLFSCDGGERCDI
jgi:hypothetical protein